MLCACGVGESSESPLTTAMTRGSNKKSVSDMEGTGKAGGLEGDMKVMQVAALPFEMLDRQARQLEAEIKTWWK